MKTVTKTKLVDVSQAKEIARTHLINPYEIISTCAVLDNAEEVDPVHAAGGVYCHECLFKDTFDCPTSKTGYTFKPMEFCSFGEKKDDQS